MHSRIVERNSQTHRRHSNERLDAKVIGKDSRPDQSKGKCSTLEVIESASNAAGYHSGGGKGTRSLPREDRAREFTLSKSSDWM